MPRLIATTFTDRRPGGCYGLLLPCLDSTLPAGEFAQLSAERSTRAVCMTRISPLRVDVVRHWEAVRAPHLQGAGTTIAHERKALMVELAHGFIALTGGYDPLLELFASYKPVSVPKWISPAQA